MEALRTALRSEEHRRLAIAGLAKNVGKTTLLGGVATLLQSSGAPLGFVSIGVDGERFDAVTGAAKPPVLLAEGDLAVTAEGALGDAACGPELLGRLGIRSVMGELFLVRASRSGRMMLAGVRFRADVEVALVALRNAGAERLLIDGAFDRLMGASAGLCDGCLLATGMAVSDRLEVVVARTVEVAERFACPVAEQAWWRGLPPALVGEREGAVLTAGVPSLLTEEAEPWLRAAALERLYAPGALSERAAALLLSLGARGPRQVVVADATHLMATTATMGRLERAGIEVRVARGVPLLGVACNPTRPEGGTPNGMALQGALAAALPKGMPVWDVVAGSVVRAGEV